MSGLITQGLHGREEDDLTDGVGVGQQHDAAVNTDTHTARGGHAVLQSVDEVLVHHAGLIVTGLTEGDLMLEAAPLIDGVVELGKGVGKFAMIDEELEALGEAGVLGGALGEGETSTGYIVMKVGWISFSSTRWSKHS